MDRRDERFSPENVEEQIEEHLRIVDDASANTHILRDLQEIGKEDVRRLKRVRERLVEHAVGNVEREPVPLQRYQNMYTIPSYQASPRHIKKTAQFMVKLVSGLVAVFVIASMLGFFALFKLHAGQENINHKTTLPALSSPTIVRGTTVFLLDVASGKVLADVNSHVRLPVASMAQMMVAVVAIENADLDRLVPVQPALSNAVSQEMSGAQLQVGDQVSLRALLYGLLLPSGNDAAFVIAQAVGGSTQKFVLMMNEEAHQLGLKDTHFSSLYSASGVDDYSSAADLTSLARYAMQLSDFTQVVAAQEYTLPATSYSHRYMWHTTNPLLGLYPGMNGIKFAYAVGTGACMVFSAQRNGRLLIGAELNASSTSVMVSGVEKLLDHGFAS